MEGLRSELPNTRGTNRQHWELAELGFALSAHTLLRLHTE